MLTSFADELTKIAVSPLIKEMAKSTLFGMGIEGVLNRDATPLSVVREGAGFGVGDVGATALAKGLGFGRLGQLAAGMIGGSALANALRKRFNENPVRHAIDKLPDTPEFQPIKQASLLGETALDRILLGAAVGGVTGAAVDKKHRVRGALAGALLGGLAGRGGHELAMLSGLTKKASPMRKKTAAAAKSVLTPQSSNVSGYSYDPSTQALNVTYKGGGTYTYKGVKANAVKALKRNKSVGKTINKLRAGLEYEKVAKQTEAWSEERERNQVMKGELGGLAGQLGLSAAMIPLLSKRTTESLATSTKRTSAMAKAMGLPYEHTTVVRGSPAFAGTMNEVKGPRAWATREQGKVVGPILHLPERSAREAIIAHELGHYKNKLNFSPRYHQIQDISRLLTGGIGGRLATGALAGQLAGELGTPSYIPAAVGAAIAAPTLFEEAAASARAAKHMMATHGNVRGLVRSLGLLPALATYTAPVAIPALITHLRKKYREEVGATKQDKLDWNNSSINKLGQQTAFGEDHYDEADDAGWKDHLPGGEADDKFPSDFDFDALDKGMKHELEHTKDRNIAMEIAMDHLTEDKNYYDKLKKVEAGEEKTSMLRERIREGGASILGSMAAQRRSMMKAAGVAKKQISFDGLPLKIEHEPGDIRSGKSKDGKTWSRKMSASYGYIPGTKGMGEDGDAVDIYLASDPVPGKVYVVKQNKKDGSFDESKNMIGYASAADAKSAYLKHMPAWAFGSMVSESWDTFKGKYGKKAA